MITAKKQQGTPLDSLTVIEFCNVAAGPFCGLLLADLGAQVIKVEPPQGDSLRQWPPLTDGFSENFASLNRNKLSLALDLKNEADNATAVRLIEAADVVIENNRPGVMDRLGLGYQRFAENHPKLIYCAMSAFGQTGPRAEDGGFDVTVQAFSGIMSVTGEPEGGPVKCAVPVSDFATGLYAAYAIAALVAQVRAGGPGGFVDISMVGASLAIGALQTSEYFGTGRDPRRLGAAHPRNAPYGAFRAADKHFIIAAGNDRLWQKVCSVAALPELLNDPRFATTRDRAENQDTLKTLLEAVFEKAPASHWLERMRAAGVPCSPINSYSEVLNDPLVQEAGWIEPLTLPSGRQTRTFGTPLSIDGTRQPVRRNPPALDADRQAILAWLDAAERERRGRRQTA